jgi:hypothetical protein
MIILFYLLSLVWAIYAASRKKKPELITIVSLVSFIGYYVIGGYLFPDEYFAFVDEKNYAISTLFPTTILAILIASLFGNILINFPLLKLKKKYTSDSFIALTVLTFAYLIVVFLFMWQIGYEIFFAESLLQYSVLRTDFVYESKLYNICFYASAYVLPFISLIFLQQNRVIFSLFILLITTLAMTLTGQKLFIVANLLLFFFFYIYNYGLKYAVKKTILLFFITILFLILIVWSFNKDTLTFEFSTNLTLVATGIIERVTLSGTVVATQYIYLAEEFNNDLLSLKPQEQSISMFVYEVIKGEVNNNVKGSIPAHIAFVQYLKHNNLLICFFTTFLIYFMLFFFKAASEIIFYDKRFAKAVNVWILVAIINLTITDSYQYLSSWLFSVLYVFGAIIFLNNFFLFFKGRFYASVPFKITAINFIAICSFFYYLQGLVRTFLKNI